MFSGGSGGFTWFLMISGGFVTVLVVTSLLPNSTEAYSDLSLKHYNKAFLLSFFAQYIFNEVAGLTQPVFTCSKAMIQTPEQCVKSVQI